MAASMAVLTCHCDCDYCQQCVAKVIEISSHEEMEVELETPEKV